MIYELLCQLNIPVAYSHFKRRVKPPFLVYFGSGSSNLKADNKVYSKFNSYQIEYYFVNKDEKKEEEIEDLLNSNDIVWEKSEDIYLDSEDLHMIVYYI